MRIGLRVGRSTSGTIARIFFVLGTAAAVAACNDSGGDVGLAANQPRVMAPGVPIAVESLSGGSESLRTKFAGALSQEASQRQIELVGAGATPRYRIRGYLDCYPGDDGKVAFAYVWDVYDVAKKQAKRVEGAAQIRGSSADPWSAVDDAAMKAVASLSMNEIAGFLVAAGPSPTKTRVAGAKPPKPKPAVADKPLAYAPVEE